MAEPVKLETAKREPQELSFVGDLKQNWQHFKQEFVAYLPPHESATNKIRKLLNVIGVEGSRLYRSLNLPQYSSNFESILDAFEAALLSTKTLTYQRYLFHTRKQGSGETFEEFLNDLKLLIKPCGFGYLEESILCDHVVFGIGDENLREKLLNYSGMTFETAVNICRKAEENVVCASETMGVKTEKGIVGRSKSVKDTVVPTAKFEECYIERDDEESSQETPQERNHQERDVVPTDVQVKSEPSDGVPSDDASDNVRPEPSLRTTVQQQAGTSRLKKSSGKKRQVPRTTIIMNDAIRKFLNQSDLEGPPPYECIVCHKTFSARGHLKNHYLIHSGETPLECNICRRKFWLQEQLERHKKLHMKPRSARSLMRPYSCDICKKTFVFKSHIVQHMNAHTGLRPHACGSCEKRFSSKQGLRQHIKSFHKNVRHTCNICWKSFAAKSSLEKHLYTTHPPSQDAELRDEMNLKPATQVITQILKPAAEREDDDSLPSLPEPLLVQPLERRHRCTVCGKGFFIKQSLDSHMLTHSDARPFKCEVCGKSFLRRGHLTEHAMIHSDVRAYQCEFCNKGFLRKWNFNQHMKTHNGSKIMPYKCHICRKTFKLKDYLKKHSHVHLNENTKTEDTEEVSYCCTTCDKAFTTKQFLERHMIAHKMLSRFDRHPCSVCNKSLSGKKALEVHMLTHTGARPFQCHICSKCFTQVGSLKYHMLTHTGERPYKCGICGKSFPSKEYLAKKHMLIHTGEKPYCCETCGKRFAVKSNLNKHLATHTTERPHQCEICQKTFSRKEDVRKHLARHQRQQQAI